MVGSCAGVGMGEGAEGGVEGLYSIVEKRALWRKEEKKGGETPVLICKASYPPDFHQLV